MSKGVHRKVYLEVDEEISKNIKVKQEDEEKMVLYKEEIEKLTLEDSKVNKKLKSADSRMVSLYTDSLGIDNELKPLLAHKAGLETEFKNSQIGLNLKRQIWEQFRVSLEEARTPQHVPFARYQEKGSPSRNQMLSRKSTCPPAQSPTPPPKISEEEMRKYFSEADFPSMVSGPSRKCRHGRCNTSKGNSYKGR